MRIVSVVWVLTSRATQESVQIYCPLQLSYCRTIHTFQCFQAGPTQHIKRLVCKAGTTKLEGLFPQTRFNKSITPEYLFHFSTSLDLGMLNLTYCSIDVELAKQYSGVMIMFEFTERSRYAVGI